MSEPSLNTMLKSQMKFMSERQGVLARNVANIDTPGYKAQDLKPVDFGKMVEAQSGRLPMASTSPKHLSGTLSAGSSFATIKDRETFESSPTDNNVVLEDQMGKISETNTQFQLSSTMLRKFTQLYRTATSNR